MKIAVIYARYSSDRQTEQSIEGQLRACHDFASRNDIVVVDTYIDRAMTGTNDNRSAFQQMLKDCSKRAWNIILVYKLDRFSRNKYEMAMHKKTLRDNGIKLVSAMENIPDTPEGIILESLLEGMAEYYSVELSQKVKRGMKETRLKGNFQGGYLLYGYKVENKKIVIDPDKAEVVRYIYEQYAQDVQVKDILQQLTDKQIYNRGKPFAINTLYNMLSNEKYSGIYHHQDEVYDNMYPRIVPALIFNLVQEKIKQNHYGKHSPNANYILRNKVFCGYCHRPISGEAGTARNGEIKRYYKCLGKKLKNGCTKQQVRKNDLEVLVVGTIIELLDDEGIMKLAEMVVSKCNQSKTDNSIINILTSEKKQIEKGITNLLNAIEQGIVTSSTKQRLDELEKRNKELEEQILFEQSQTQTQVTIEDVLKLIKTAMSKNAKTMIQILVEKIVLYDDKVEIYFKDFNKTSLGENQGFLFYSVQKTVVETCENYNVTRERTFEIDVIIKEATS